MKDEECAHLGKDLKAAIEREEGDDECRNA